MTNAHPFGSWPSPISAELVAAGGVGLGGPAVRTGSDGSSEVWWSELRPAEAGRVVLVRRTAGSEPEEQLPKPFSARTRVHEYGGGAWFLGAEAVYFSNWSDQRLYRFVTGSEPVAITPEPVETHQLRYADGQESPDGEWIVAVQERHGGDGAEVVNEIVAFPSDGSADPQVIASGTDFVMAPRLSPDGRWLSWLRWDHPNMPWDGTELCAAPVFTNTGFRLGNTQLVAGGPGEAVHGANWTAGGQLVFSTDRSGYWNLHQWHPGDTTDHAITALDDADIGYPPWVFGIQHWSELSDGRFVAIVTREAADSLALVQADGRVSPIASPYVSVSGLATTAGDAVVVVAQTKIDLPLVVELAASGHTFDHRPSDDLGVDPRWFSVAESFDFESAGGRQCHAFLYRPTGLDVTGEADELPPLIVIGHGGPTAHASPILGLKIQYWTSRGFAVVDVNYGGSSGYGRAYRQLLHDAWGVVDVEDCIAAASQLAEAGKVDGNRMAIRGGSAGGFTVLAALTGSDVFAAGTSLYGVADLEALATDTHKFESRYLDGLIGPYPEAKAIYDLRSPINHTDQLSCPLLVLQGTEDEIVPPNQAEAIVASLASKGIPHAAIYFEGEQHGFRQAENIVRSLEAELWFYGRVFDFQPADPIDPIEGAVGL
ncbi:MAG: dipeptidyl aminopeptidase/acylaminoacyl peptidase [Acidimicrobiales bacterium]|jgi:dipeptidyl aminopeptidase/acylaminoacyl peptidase